MKKIEITYIRKLEYSLQGIVMMDGEVQFDFEYHFYKESLTIAQKIYPSKSKTISEEQFKRAVDRLDAIAGFHFGQDYYWIKE